MRSGLRPDPGQGLRRVQQQTLSVNAARRTGTESEIHRLNWAIFVTLAALKNLGRGIVIIDHDTAFRTIPVTDTRRRWTHVAHLPCFLSEGLFVSGFATPMLKTYRYFKNLLNFPRYLNKTKNTCQY